MLVVGADVARARVGAGAQRAAGAGVVAEGRRRRRASASAGLALHGAARLRRRPHGARRARSPTDGHVDAVVEAAEPFVAAGPGAPGERPHDGRRLAAAAVLPERTGLAAIQERLAGVDARAAVLQAQRVAPEGHLVEIGPLNWASGHPPGRSHCARAVRVVSAAAANAMAARRKRRIAWEAVPSGIRPMGVLACGSPVVAAGAWVARSVGTTLFATRGRE